MDHVTDRRTTELTAEQMRSLAEGRAVFLFFSVYLVCFTLSAIVLTVVANIWTVDTYSWGLWGVVFGSLAPTTAIAVGYYTWATWHFVVETTTHS